MNLARISVKNLIRRKTKMTFVLLGLVIGIATTISIYSVVETMKAEMAGQLAAYGANVVITADTGEISFSYGGISIPEVLFDVEKLKMDDLSAISGVPSFTMVRAVIPSLLGMVQVNGQDVVIAGSDLKRDFSVKPWLRFRNMLKQETTQEPVANGSGMAADKLDLSREDFDSLHLGSAEVILGANVSYNLSLFPGDPIILNGKSFRVAAILQKNGSSEDNEVLMDLAAAQELMAKPDEISVIELSADYNLGSEEVLLAQLEEALPTAKIISLRKVMLDQDELVTRLTRFGTAISIIVLIAGLLVAALTMTSAVRERTREIGIFRAIGFRKVHIAKILLLEGIMVSTAAGILGYTIGTVIARVSGPLLADAALLVPWRLDLFGLSILLAWVIGSLASIFPVWQAARLDPAEAIHHL
jgi:putative ABC transport system permease protein